MYNDFDVSWVQPSGSTAILLKRTLAYPGLCSDGKIRGFKLVLSPEISVKNCLFFLIFEFM